MAKLNEFDTKALRALAREFNVDRHEPPLLQRAFIVSVGRLFLKDMKRLEAADPDVVEWNGRDYWINGVDLRYPHKVSAQLKPDQWVRYYVSRHEGSIRHVVDWLTIAVREGHAWLDNLDHLGRPKKLMKCGSIEALVGEAERQFARLRERAVHALRELTSDDLRWVSDLDHGLRLVQLLSPAALDDEGQRMKHCIGLGPYDDSLNDPDIAFYSVRDGDENSVATLEVDGTIVRQFVGLANGKVREDVAVAVSNHMIKAGWQHWIEVYEEDVKNFNEYHRLCRVLAMPYHACVMTKFRMLSDERKAQEISRLRVAAGLGPTDPVPDPPIAVYAAMDDADINYYEIVIGPDGEPQEVEVTREEYMRGP